MRMKQLAVAIALIGAGAAISAHAEEKVNKVERVEITGSSIKRVQKEGAAPVETISRKQIEKTGATTVNELLKSVSSLDTFDQGEISSNSPSGSGGANAKMRGLGETDLLVLLNGRRLPVNAMADGSGSGAAVDINLIPLSAIERVEILKDGGSAIYGADAVAGVINFITKKNYQGGDLRAKTGISSRGDANETSVGMSAGFGDYEEDGFNVLASFDVFKRDPIYRADRDLTKSADFRRFGGPDGRSSYSPYGNKLDSKGRFTGEQVKPCPADLLVDGRCRYDFGSSLLTSFNGADRMSGMGVARLRVSDTTTAYIQGFYSTSTDHFEAHPVPDFFKLPDGSSYAGRFMQGGPRITDRQASLSQFVMGLEGSVAGFDWSVAAGHGLSQVYSLNSNYFDANKWDDALSNGLIDATVTTNNPALVESLKVKATRDASNALYFVDSKISGETPLALPGGKVAFAVGASYTKEVLKDTPDALTQAGLVVGGIAQAGVDASRDNKALFAEISLPVHSTLEVQGAVRYDSYSSENSSSESKASPKVSIRFQPLKELLLRASYAKSFRMPTLKQLNGGVDQGAMDIKTADECLALGEVANCAITAYEVSGSNKNLTPETGTSFNVGVVADVGIFSGSVDWWKIQKDDTIGKPSVLEALQAKKIGHDKDGRLLVFTNLQNISKFESSGIDVEGRLRFPTSFGTYTFSDSATYYLEQRQTKASGEWENLKGIYASPIWRNTFRAEADFGAWSSALAVRTTGDFLDTDIRETDTLKVPAGVPTVPSYTETDLSVTYTGFKGLKLDAGVKNVFDNMPPFSLRNVETNTHSQMGFAELYNVRGRFFSVGAQYSFK
ncbi:TonB-dependent receptor [Iodobacter sp. HSC-16F04]|uniref:TonB-dependent receptor n=1 Tax=Iodobacter violaceini TaxID=3044271 RepID=A0ABX0KZ35_9NEIS|nr:TonB-dependent receptor [Iodobacter violacea]NHQ86341.1 TonB-dependent receptor [Iodobacter violacea]